MHTWIGYAHPDRLISYPDARYLSAYVLTPGSCPPTGAVTSPNISPLSSTSCAAASNRAAGQTGQNSPCMRKTTQNARILASRANFVTQAPPTGHAGRILSRNTLHSGNAGRVPSRLQLRGRTLAPECARKPLDMHAGGAARTHVVGPRCRSSGLHAPGAHTQGSTQYSQEPGTHNYLKPRLSRTNKPKSHPSSNTICPSS